MKNFNRMASIGGGALLTGLLAAHSAWAQEAPEVLSEGAAQSDAQAEAPSAAPTSPARQRGAREIELQTTSVSGNRELPRVMVVVPWKSAAPAELGGRPIVSLVEEALAPVDREVFQRELEYYGLLHGGPRDDAAQLAKTASNLTEE